MSNSSKTVLWKTTRRVLAVVLFGAALFTSLTARLAGNLARTVAEQVDAWEPAGESLPSPPSALRQRPNGEQNRSPSALAGANTDQEKQQESRMFLKGRAMTNKDVFAASWWQCTERFLDFKDAASELKTVEDDSFKPILKAGNGHADVRMSRDLLDFNVEHISKWWKDAGDNSVAYAQAKFNNYTSRIRSRPTRDDYMKDTLAVIPYGVTDNKSPSTKQLWASALAATITSLLNHQIGRIVVVGHFETDETLSRQVFAELATKDVAPAGNTETRYFETMIGVTEVAFVHTENVNSTFISKNIPKGALVDLQDALAGRSDNPVPYLGRTANATRFKYIFLTEADQILNARITPEFLDELDARKIIVPHRIQPMLHPNDLNGVQLPKAIRSLPGHKAVIELDEATSSCCDANYHQKDYNKVCATHWFRCGYGSNKGRESFNHLDEYDFISISDGVGIVALAGNQHSRRCVPVKNGRGKC